LKGLSPNQQYWFGKNYITERREPMSKTNRKATDKQGKIISIDENMM
jgi:hypothetical protein